MAEQVNTEVEKHYSEPPFIIDTETVGLAGFIVLIQYALGDGEIQLYSPWENPVRDTIDLIESFATNPGGVVLFNATFDWFHLYKMWTVWKMLAEIDDTTYPEDNIDLIIDLEEKARDYPDCLKPVKVLDLFLHARKGPYQSTMDRKDIIIRRVPTPIAWMVAEELERRVPLKDIYFARRKDKNQPKWQIQERKDTYGDYDRDWKNIVVRFKPSSALKALAVDTGMASDEIVLKYGDISPKLHPVEFGFAPFAKAAMKIKLRNKSKQKARQPFKYKGTWPDRIKTHIQHWGYHEMARQYAKDDIVYTRGLLKYFNYPPMGDDDSELACMVGCVRWKGFRVDLDGIRLLKQRALDKRNVLIINHGKEELVPIPTAPNDVKRYIMEVCDETEKLAIQADTKKVTLEYLAKTWTLPCPKCDEYITGVKPTGWCDACKSDRLIKHEAAKRAQQILDSRKAAKEIELYDKILAAGRLHASFKVIGTLSSRMSGADGLNAQAIKKTDEVKGKFILAWPGFVLAGGDFEGFEVTIAEAVYNDPDLRKDLLTCEPCGGAMIFNQDKVDYICEGCGGNKGKKIHALFGVFVYPDMTYEQIKATDGTEDDKYSKCKQAVFAMMYGGEGHTLQTRLGVPLETAEEAHRKFCRRYKGVGRAQQTVNDLFGSMRQPEGRGTKVEWHDPAEKIETLFGFARYFTLENKICKALYDLAGNMPKAMKELKMKVRRTDRDQEVHGAARSAIYGAAFAIQSFNKRAATNHVIQGSGAQITKRVQRRIWDIQPTGIHEWVVQPLNIHDSVMTPIKPAYIKQVADVVYTAVEEIRPTIPLIKMPWESYLGHWADKCGPICSVNKEGAVVGAYKSRKALKPFGLSLKEVHRCLAKEQDTYEGLSWRTMTKEESSEYKKKDLWTKV
jgi:Zn finger protein HypA/HybF involved in hydrogenase expression